MSKPRGFALVAVLGVSVVVIIMALAMIYMSQSNLEIASNSRVNTEARYAAEGGIDTAIATLNQGILEDSRDLQLGNYAVSVNVEDINTPDDSQAQEDEDDFDPTESEIDTEEKSLFLISARSSGPSNSEYQASAVVAVDGSPGNWTEVAITDPLNSGPGIISEGSCNLNTSKKGGSEISNGIHCNRGFDLKGGTLIGSGGNNDDATASCDGTAGKKLKCKCKDKITISGHTQGDYCISKKLPKYLTPPMSVPVPNYRALKTWLYPTGADYGPLDLGDRISIKRISDLIPGFVPATAPNQKVIVLSGTGNLTFESGMELKNIVLVMESRANVQITGDVKLENSTIIAEKVRITGNLELKDSRILANKEVAIKSGLVTYSGVSTLASGKNIKLIQADIEGPNDDKNILNLFATKDVKGAGYIKAQTALIAGGKFTYK